MIMLTTSDAVAGAGSLSKSAAKNAAKRRNKKGKAGGEGDDQDADPVSAAEAGQASLLSAAGHSLAYSLRPGVSMDSSSGFLQAWKLQHEPPATCSPFDVMLFHPLCMPLDAMRSRPACALQTWQRPRSAQQNRPRQPSSPAKLQMAALWRANQQRTEPHLQKGAQS